MATIAKVKQEPFVPTVGLVIDGVVLILLIVTIAGNWLWGLDFFHVVGGAIWTTIDLFMGFIIGPILARLDPPSRIALTKRLMPKMLVLMPTVVISTLAGGWQLVRRVGYLNIPYPQHWWLTASFIVVGLMAIVAYGVLEPANILVLLELRKPEPNVGLIGRTMKRFIWGAAVTGAGQIAILIIMTRIATW
jgi:hypothetical protein